MIRPENIPRRQRCLEPQANLMNIGVSFPSSSVQEFYHYGGTGGFGTPFVAPFWGYAHNFPSFSSHSSSSSHVETVVKKEIPVVKKEVKKTEVEIYDETAFTKQSVKEPAKQSRLSMKERIEVKKIGDQELIDAIEAGDEAEKKGDKKNEAIWHRYVQEQLSKLYGIKLRFIDPEVKNIYAYNSLNIHEPSIVQMVLKEGLTIEEVFFYSKEDNHYFIKDKYEKKFNVKPKSELLYSNKHLLPQNRKKDQNTNIIINNCNEKKVTSIVSQQSGSYSESLIMTIEEYDKYAFSK
jgi:hypothetical protein